MSPLRESASRSVRRGSSHDDNDDIIVLFDRHHHDSHHAVDSPPPPPSSDPLRRRRRIRPALNGLNLLNVVTYFAHLFVSWGIGTMGLWGWVDTRWQISMEYETLITPALWNYNCMWYPILSLEGVFSLAQLLPYFRARPIVQEGTGFSFFYTFCSHTLWTIFMALHLFTLSFVTCVAALMSLIVLIQSQQQTIQSTANAAAILTSAAAASSSRPTTISLTSQRRYWEYILFQLPFTWHLGWMFVVTSHHFSLLFRSYDCPVPWQLAIDAICLAWLLPVALYFLQQRRPTCGSWQPDFAIPMVILVSYIGIATRLEHADEKMLTLFGAQQIETLKIMSYMLAGTIGCMWIPAAVVWLVREFCTISVVEIDE